MFRRILLNNTHRFSLVLVVKQEDDLVDCIPCYLSADPSMDWSLLLHHPPVRCRSYPLNNARYLRFSSISAPPYLLSTRIVAVHHLPTSGGAIPNSPYRVVVVVIMQSLMRIKPPFNNTPGVYFFKVSSLNI